MTSSGLRPIPTHRRALLVGLALALTLGACGSSAATTATQSPTTEEGLAIVDPLDVPAAVARAHEEAGTGRYRLTMTPDGLEPGQVIEAYGEFSLELNAAITTLDLTKLRPEGPDDGEPLDRDASATGIPDQPITFMVVEDRVFMTDEPPSPDVPDKRVWLSEEDTSQSPKPDWFEIEDPLAWVERLDEDGLTVSRGSTETFDGVATTEYKIVSDRPSSDPVRIWVDEDYLIRHFEITIIDHPEEGGFGSDLTIVGDLFNLGDPIEIKAPEVDQFVQDVASTGD